MVNILVALGAEDDFVVGAEARFNALPSIGDFNRAMAIADLPPPVAVRLGDQFEVQLTASRGHYMFGVSDLPQTGLDRNLDIRWEGVKRLGTRVAHQFLGPGVEKVSLRGTIYPPHFGRFEDLERMRADALAGRPRTFVTGYGSYAGIWCIKGIKDAQRFYFPNGYPRKVEFTIELVHYGQDSMSFGSIGAALGTDDTATTNALQPGAGSVDILTESGLPLPPP